MTNDREQGEPGPFPADDQGQNRHGSDNSRFDREAEGDGADDGDITSSSTEGYEEDEGSIESRDEGSVEGGTEAHLIELIHAVIAERSESYSGLLPHPEHWGKFDMDTQERILRMSESFTTDESARRDRIVNAEVAEAPKGRRNAMLIYLVSILLAGVAALAFSNNVAAGIFVSVPLISTVRDFIRGRNAAPRQRESDS